MTKPRLIAPIRPPLLVAVFVGGLGIGAAAIAITHHETTSHHAVATRTRSTSAQAPSKSDARTGSRSTSHPPSVTSGRAQGAPARRPSHPRAPSIPAPAVASSFAALEARLSGPVGLAVAPLGVGPIRAFGRAQIAHAWSTSKVPVLVTLLANDEQRGTGLDSTERENATRALTESDNAAVEALFSSLERLRGGLVPASESIQAMFRKAGDSSAIVNTAPNDEGFTTYGQSEWSLRDEIIFYRALARGCLLDADDTGYVLGLMSNVTPSQRWGAGSAGYPGSVNVQFKGGWGPVDGAYQVRQTAIIGSGSQGYVLSMLALPASGSFSDGTNMLTALATWARRHFDLAARQRPHGCSGT
jgi:hypothetical protein